MTHVGQIVFLMIMTHVGQIVFPEEPSELPRADVDLSAHTFEGTPASEDETFAREVDRKLLYLD